jgi:glycerophosphoryl diester phosphodiesterase
MKIIGHRGAKGLAAENTLASFKRALEYQVDGIELDVHLTKDGVLVCSHDPVLFAFAKPFAIAEHTYDDLLRNFPDLPTLESAIETVNRRVPMVIEVKETTPAQPVIECIQGFLSKGWQLQDFSFCSFSQWQLVELRKAFPDAELIPNEDWSSVKACWRARQLHSKRISMNQKWLWRGYLRAMHNRGWKVSSYTINDVNQFKKWQPYLYSVYTDYPDRFVKPKD